MSFTDALSKVGNAFDKAKDADLSSGGFDRDEVEDGTYVTQLSRAVFGVDKNSNAYVAFDFEIQPPSPEAGKKVTRFHSISAKGDRTLQMSIESLFRDMHTLDSEFDPKESDEAQVEACITLLDDTELFVKVALKTSANGYQNLYVNGVLDDDDDDQKPVDGSNDPWIPIKGEEVMFKPPRARNLKTAMVTSVNVRKALVNLKIDDKTFKAVPFDAVTRS